MENPNRSIAGRLLKWGKPVVAGLLSMFFLSLGIDTLMSAYHLENPHYFVMYFFSSNMIILVSIVGLIYAGVKLHTGIKGRSGKEDEPYE